MRYGQDQVGHVRGMGRERLWVSWPRDGSQLDNPGMTAKHVCMFLHGGLNARSFVFFRKSREELYYMHTWLFV